MAYETHYHDAFGTIPIQSETELVQRLNEKLPLDFGDYNGLSSTVIAELCWHEDESVEIKGVAGNVSLPAGTPIEHVLAQWKSFTEKQKAQHELDKAAWRKQRGSA
jgi:hypothetical protein